MRSGSRRAQAPDDVFGTQAQIRDASTVLEVVRDWVLVSTEIGDLCGYRDYHPNAIFPTDGSDIWRVRVKDMVKEGLDRIGYC